MVTGGGLEVHSVHPSRQALRLDSTVPLQARACPRAQALPAVGGSRAAAAMPQLS